MTEEEVAVFHQAWGNTGFAADQSFLAELLRLLSSGPVLECGTGGTTLLANVMGLRNGFKTYCLEQDASWASEVARWGLRSVRVLDAPLKNHGSYRWYEVQEALPKHFSLIVCDGPYIAKEHGQLHYSAWRYGLLPWLKETGRTFDVLLLDDVNDPRGPPTLERWKREFGISAERVASENGELAIIRPAEFHAPARSATAD
jgi:hypothetical protein